MRSPLGRRAIARWRAGICGSWKHLVWLAGPYLQSSVNYLMRWASFAKHWTIPTSRWQKQSWGPGCSLSSDRSTWWSHRNWIWMISILFSPCPQPGAFWSFRELKDSSWGNNAQRAGNRAKGSWGLSKATGSVGGGAGNKIQFFQLPLYQSFCWVVLELILRRRSAPERAYSWNISKVVDAQFIVLKNHLAGRGNVLNVNKTNLTIIIIIIIITYQTLCY